MIKTKFVAIAVVAIVLSGIGKHAVAFDSPKQASITVDAVGGADYLTIQAAINSAVNGDVVVVAPGTYNERINLKGKAITLRSSDGAQVTIIDGGRGGTVVACDSSESSQTVLDGFTIQNGSGKDCSDTYSSRFYGGGMYINRSSPVVRDCVFTNNVISDGSYSGGGAINSSMFSDPQIIDCTFINNSITSYSGMGGAIYNHGGNITITGCLFSSNIVTGNFSEGGAIYNGYGEATITNCTFLNNNAKNQGGGIYNMNISPVITNCWFQGNLGGDHGGGISNYNGSDPVITNCIFYKNKATDYYGGAIYSYVESNPLIVNCVIYGNTASYGGGGIYSSSAATIKNSIIWNNTSLVFGNDELSGTNDISYSCVRGGASGEGNISLAPVFVSTSGADFHLVARSPCINAGSNDAISTGITTDLDGNNRILYGLIDMGAYEYVDTISPTVVLSEIDSPSNLKSFEVTATFSENVTGFTIDDIIVTNGIASAFVENGKVYTFTVTAETDGIVSVEIPADIALDIAGNDNLAAQMVSVNYDGTAPRVESVAVQIAGAIYITFSEAMGEGVTSAANYTISGGGKGTLADHPDQVQLVAGSNYTYLLSWNSGDMAIGDVTITVAGSADMVGNEVDQDNSSRTHIGGGISDITVCVDGSAVGNNNGTSWVDAFTSIQAAIDDTGTAAGDIIIVATGVYNETIRLKGKAITLQSTKPENADIVASTIIDGTGKDTSTVACRDHETHDTVISGLTITGGKGTYMNMTRYGGGIFIYEIASPTVKNCVFRNNDGFNGGGMSNQYKCSPLVINCTFIGNTSGGGGGINNWLESNPVVINCIFQNNHADYQGGAINSVMRSKPQIINCFFYNNSAVYGGGAVCSQNDSDVTVANTIFLGNSSANYGQQIERFDGRIDVSYCCIAGGWQGEGNIDADPLLVDVRAGNFRLTENSQCIDSGNNSMLAQYAVTEDITGKQRFIDGSGRRTAKVDMGPYEYGTVIYVTAGGSIQAAINDVNGIANIVVGPGTYNELIDFNGKLITIESSDGPLRTIISGEGLGGSVVTCANLEPWGSMIAGFTITGGSGTDVDGIKVGGGVYSLDGAVTVYNCIITGNIADKGAGVYSKNSYDSIVNCLIKANTASVSGAIVEDDSSSFILSCTITDNNAGEAAVSLTGQSYPYICNNIIWGNVAVSAILEGDYCQPGYATNCVEDSNLPEPGDLSDNFYADPMFADASAGDYSLEYDSPCVDNGSGLTEYDDFVFRDLAGSSRVINVTYADWPQVDIGAYEFLGIAGDFVIPYGVDISDFVVLSDQWQSVPGSPSADIAEPFDGFVGVSDLAVFCDNWLTGI